MWKFEISTRVKQFPKFWTNICGQISRGLVPSFFGCQAYRCLNWVPYVSNSTPDPNHHPWVILSFTLQYILNNSVGLVQCTCLYNKNWNIVKLWWWAWCLCSSSLYAQHARLCGGSCRGGLLLLCASAAFLHSAAAAGVKFPASSTPVVRPRWRGSPRNTEHKLLSHRTQGTGLHAIIYWIKERDF